MEAPMNRWMNLAAMLLTMGALAGCGNQVAPTLDSTARDRADCKFPEPMTTLLKTNPNRAVAACRHLAEQGDPVGEARLGYLYQAGLGGSQDFAAAAQWYRLAAGQGNAAAQNNLGSMYEKGQGVPQDLVQAAAWFNLAAAQGNADAARNRDLVAKRLTPEQNAEAEKLAKTWQAAKGP
jgi:TPR repeat protein